MKSPVSGFTLIEMAIVMVVIGLLAGGGTFVMGMLTERKARNESIDYLYQAKEALLSYASTQGTLPQASANTDGTVTDGDGQADGFFPYLDLKLKPTDFYKRVLKYEIDPNLDTDLATTCNALKAGLVGDPDVVDADGSVSAFPVAAVLVSSGPMDADGDGNIFDVVTSAVGLHEGDNTDGDPNYLRYPPNDDFDDLVVYIGEHELYSVLCDYVTLAVNNSCGAGTDAYAFDVTRGTLLGQVAPSNTDSWEILSGTKVEIRDGPGGGASVLASKPPTPLIVAGKDKDVETCAP